jgi:hypothetical protein
MIANQRSAKPDFQFRFAMIQVLLLRKGILLERMVANIFQSSINPINNIHMLKML